MEEVQPADLDVLGNGPLEVLIAHDTPTGAVPASTFRIPITDEAQSQVSRDLLRRAVDTVRPRLVFCGHWHQRRTFEVPDALDPAKGGTIVQMLDMDGGAGNWVVLDLDDLSVNDPRRALAR